MQACQKSNSNKRRSKCAENRKPAAVSKRDGCHHRHVCSVFAFCRPMAKFLVSLFLLSVLNKVPLLSVRKALVLSGTVVSCAITEQKLKRIQYDRNKLRNKGL